MELTFCGVCLKEMWVPSGFVWKGSCHCSKKCREIFEKLSTKKEKK